MSNDLNSLVTELAQTFDQYKTHMEKRLDQVELSYARTTKWAPGADEGEETEAMRDWLKGKTPNSTKALSVTDDGQGVVVRSDWADRVFSLVRETSPMRMVASVITTDSNETEVLVDRGEAATAWTTEKAARSDTAVDFMTRHKILNSEHYALPSVTTQMLEDSKFDVEGFVQQKVGNSFSRQEATAFIVGDGSGKPRGILDYGTVPEADFAWGADPDLYTIGAQYTAADGDITDADVLFDLVDSLKVDYLAGASWMMTRAFRNKIRKLKDTQDRYLFEDSLQAGTPARLLGYPVYLAEDMPTPAADVVGALFGNFRQAYTICDRAGLAVLRDPYSTPGYVRWYARRRVGGALTNPEAVKALVLGTEPA